MSFRKELGRFDTAMVVVGGIIGAGIMLPGGGPEAGQAALFVGAAVLIVGSVLWSNPLRSGIGFAILVTGVPAYLFWSSMTGGDNA